MTSLPAVAASELSPWRHQSVLVVDDEPGMVSFLQRSLESRCGWVASAGSVEQAAPPFPALEREVLLVQGADGVRGVVAVDRTRRQMFERDE